MSASGPAGRQRMIPAPIIACRAGRWAPMALTPAFRARHKLPSNYMLANQVPAPALRLNLLFPAQPLSVLFRLAHLILTITAAHFTEDGAAARPSPHFDFSSRVA